MYALYLENKQNLKNYIETYFHVCLMNKNRKCFCYHKLQKKLYFEIERLKTKKRLYFIKQNISELESFVYLFGCFFENSRLNLSLSVCFYDYQLVE